MQLHDVDFRRVVSWCAFQIVRHKANLKKCIQAAAARSNPFPEEWIRACFPHAQAAVDNAKLCRRPECRKMRLCDVPGIKLPKGTGD